MGTPKRFNLSCLSNINGHNVLLNRDMNRRQVVEAVFAVTETADGFAGDEELAIRDEVENLEPGEACGFECRSQEACLEVRRVS
jgi:hypothetical protein